MVELLLKSFIGDISVEGKEYSTNLNGVKGLASNRQEMLWNGLFE